MAKKNYYAVRVGKVPGIFTNWDEAKDSVSGYPNAEYKGFKTQEEAESYLGITAPAVAEEITLAAKEAVAYVDGSYNATTKRYGYGVHLMCGDETYELTGSGEDTEGVRQITGEVKGAEKAIESAIRLGASSITIYYDYKGIEMWATGEWKAKSAAARSYKSFIDKVSRDIEIRFEKVAAHTGDKYNTIADKLAKKAVGI